MPQKTGRKSIKTKIYLRSYLNPYLIQYQSYYPSVVWSNNLLKNYIINRIMINK